MLLKIKEFSEIIKNPVEDSEIKIEFEKNKVKSVKSGLFDFKITNNLPVLINFNESIFAEDFYTSLKKNESIIGNRSVLKKKIKSLFSGSGINSNKFFNIFRKKLKNNSRLLIIGGGNIGTGIKKIYEDKSLQIISTDVYPSDNIQFISDAHNLPLKNETIDGVVIQAVLEHVVDPNKVVKEIFRVLKKNGIVYAETPFMQQTHEEPYDFQRYTELGHRFLFKSFEEIYRGTNGGPGLSLYWSIKSFIYSLINNKILSEIISFPLIILSYIDFLIPEKRKIKSANGFIFIGKKSENKINKKNLPKIYLGNC